VPRHKDVGRSPRTPAKHALMNSIYGREIGVVSRSPNHRSIQRHVWKDLTAGDGVPDDGLEWRYNCSPGINAHHATKAGRPVDVELYEIQPNTFDRLIDSLAENLPLLGYRRCDETSWQFAEHVALRAICGSGADAPVANIRNTDAVLVSNDPNAITTWAMRPTFAQEISARAWCFRSISTMGCNPAGLKRSEPTVRAGWFDLIKQQEAASPPHRDLLLTAIEGDKAQWAYLLGEPAKWRQSVESTVKGAFRRYGYSMEMVWHRTDPAGFDALKARLFLTRSELAG
jgi:hypothetical protein